MMAVGDNGISRAAAFLTCLFFSAIFIHTNALENEVEDEHPFNYELRHPKGPENWGDLNPHWRACKTGKLQSPIDLHEDNGYLESDFGSIRRTYKAAPAVLKNRGHDIMILWTADAGGITLNGTEYKLLQCHWHTPSEHTVNGEKMKMELHMVHNSPRGQIAVVSVLYRVGHRDKFLGKVLEHMKSAKNPADAEKGINLGEVNPWTVKVSGGKYYGYVGSLTVPPCTEGVFWTVLKKVREVSEEQVSALREAVHDGFEENARPIQRRGGKPRRPRST